MLRKLLPIGCKNKTDLEITTSAAIMEGLLACAAMRRLALGTPNGTGCTIVSFVQSPDYQLNDAISTVILVLSIGLSKIQR